MPWSLLLNPTVLLGLALAGALGWGSIQTWRLEAANGRTASLVGEYAVRDAKAQEAATIALQAAQTRARTAEQKSATDVAAVSVKYEQEKANVAKHTQKTIADLHTGALSLRVTLADSAAQGDRGGTSETGAAAGKCDGGTGSGLLSEPDSAFLVAEAGRADEIVAQLTAAQTVILKDREICK
jgi:hypothetical protein